MFEGAIHDTERSTLYAHGGVSRLPTAPLSGALPLRSKRAFLLTRQPVKARRVFISYAREDLAVAKTLYRKLKERGHDPWMDEHSLRKGADWQLEIKSAIENCEFFVAIISKQSVQKTGFVQIEVHNAAQEQLKRPPGVIYFIPVKIDDCKLPEFAARFNYLDLVKTPHPYKALYQSIETV